MRRRLITFLGALGVFLGAAVLIGGTLVVADTANAQGGIKEIRSAAMKSLGGSMRGIGQAASMGDAQGPVKTIVDVANRMESLFPEGSGGPDTRSKPEIWANMGDFKAKIAAFKTASQTLSATASSGDLAAVKAAVRGVGATCGACHKVYRVPKT